jgi:glutathionylspermidine synthase
LSHRVNRVDGHVWTVGSIRESAGPITGNLSRFVPHGIVDPLREQPA